MVAQDNCEGKLFFFSEVYFKLSTAPSSQANALIRLNYRFLGTRAHLFLSNHQIYVPWLYLYWNRIIFNLRIGGKSFLKNFLVHNMWFQNTQNFHKLGSVYFSFLMWFLFLPVSFLLYNLQLFLCITIFVRSSVVCK